MSEGYSTHNSVSAKRASEQALLRDALGILHRFATENTGWRSFFRRWYYSDEPLRNDAANLVRRAEFQMKQPERTKLVGSYEHEKR
jgi:hypothetical protein